MTYYCYLRDVLYSTYCYLRAVVLLLTSSRSANYVAYYCYLLYVQSSCYLRAVVLLSTEELCQLAKIVAFVAVAIATLLVAPPDTSLEVLKVI